MGTTNTSTDKVKATLDQVVERFERGEVGELIAKASYPPCNVPSGRWSLHNRVLAAMQGTADARGFRQWEQVGRKVKKGSKAIAILGPNIVKRKETDEHGQETESTFLAGFRAIPVFRVEDTEGAPLDYEQIELPAHPLLDVAAAWGISVRACSGNGVWHGCYRSDGVIMLATPDEQTFFHELAHAADERVQGGPLKGGQHADQEIVAQLAAEVLCRMVGRKLDQGEGYTFAYVSRYAAKWYPDAAPADALRKACHRVLGRTCKAVECILAAAGAAHQGEGEQAEVA